MDVMGNRFEKYKCSQFCRTWRAHVLFSCWGLCIFCHLVFALDPNTFVLPKCRHSMAGMGEGSGPIHETVPVHDSDPLYRSRLQSESGWCVVRHEARLFWIYTDCPQNTPWDCSSVAQSIQSGFRHRPGRIRWQRGCW